ncbi:YARHG domain-containing protein [Thiorhodovibrio frisius]|uniref:YARHG domain-containing protein n=1 Tax=Thiorhodovibrio frisius TaxID=631362 RepID=H8YYY8_9GAMM|nr:YARHG domain-containing protein [Thiorhodovibrio frisius]EIC21915.1 hypothetical protein Thi970DRAFT_02151 [Thiorhodovibrio frisius]WPL24204.1 hypothetical protein Thiofri_04420 [Thiorhodovibrio frisius]
MIKFKPALALGISILATSAAAPVMAQSCMDLWYQRNLIYAQNGYCFSTSLGKRQFAEYKCWTKNPDLTQQEQKRVDSIRAEERRRGCKVN